MYPSLAAAKAAIISVGEEIATEGLSSGICPLVFVFTGSGHGNASINLFNITLFLNFCCSFFLFLSFYCCTRVI